MRVLTKYLYVQPCHIGIPNIASSGHADRIRFGGRQEIVAERIVFVEWFQFVRLGKKPF